MSRRAKHGPDPQRLVVAERELERSRRDYVAAIHDAARTEQTSNWFMRIRERNHLGPSFGDVYRRDR